MAERILKGQYTNSFLRRSFAQWPNVLKQFDRIWQQLSRQMGGDITVVEIGTYRGISTSVIARHVSVVHTYDIEIQPEAVHVWKTEGVSNRIHQHKIIGPLVRECLPAKFDAVFIDGNHSYEDALWDYETVKDEAKVIVFDDVTVQFPGVVRLLKEIEWSRKWIVLYCGRFAICWRHEDEEGQT